MSAEESTTIDLLYRSPSHLMLWHIVQDAGFWDELGASVTFTFCDSPAQAEEVLTSQGADFISGNHITPYLRQHEGVPLVCIAQPWRHVNDVLISHEPLGDLQGLRGKTVADRPLRRSSGAVVHPTGNHLLYLERAGLDPFTDIVRDEQPRLREAEDKIVYILEGAADASFIPAHEAAAATERGLQVLRLGPLPMIHGPTVTAFAPHLRSHPDKALTALRGLAMGIRHFLDRPAETKNILRSRYPDKSEAGIEQTYSDVADQLVPTMYPDPHAVANAFRLCQMGYGDRVADAEPLAVWDLHYLRQLDDEGFFRCLAAPVEVSPG